MHNAFTLGASDYCQISVSANAVFMEEVNNVLNKTAQAEHVNVIRFDPYLCDSQHCTTQVGGEPIYRDDHHLSFFGSEYLGQKMKIAGLIDSKAR